ncbi:MAG: thioredoxin domain-containing protein [Nanoarchaeota archaeon]|nr:thioredoxin domain-containing protein [Nanoarchaeota archaeon]
MVKKLSKTASLAAMINAIGCGAASPSIETPAVAPLLRPIVPVEQYHVEQLTHDNFDPWIQESDLPVVVDFWKERCGACTDVKPVFNKICAEMQGDVYCAGFDTAQDRELPDRIPARYDVRYIPGFRFFCHGTEQPGLRLTGYMDESELRSAIEGFLESCD